MRGLGGGLGYAYVSQLSLVSPLIFCLKKKKILKKTKHKRELRVTTHVSVFLIYPFSNSLSLLFSLPSPPCLPTLRLSCPLVLGTQSIPGAYSSATIKAECRGK